MNTRSKLGFLATLLACTAFSAPAATITQFTRAQFQLAVNGSSVTQQDFDSLPVGSILAPINGVTYGASGGTPIVTSSYLTTTGSNGLGSSSVGFFLASESATFSFSSAITAFAIDINTFAGTAGDYTATLNIGDVILSKFDVFPGTATGQFIGFTSDVAFSSVTISTASGFPYTLDTLVYGDAATVADPTSTVPEPSAWLSLAPGLLLLRYLRSKKAK